MTLSKLYYLFFLNIDFKVLSESFLLKDSSKKELNSGIVSNLLGKET